MILNSYGALTIVLKVNSFSKIHNFTCELNNKCTKINTYETISGLLRVIPQEKLGIDINIYISNWQSLAFNIQIYAMMY